MKKHLLNLIVPALAILMALPAYAVSPKREHRSAWVTTCWGNSWPTTRGSTSSAATSQKNEAIEYLDLMQENGFNAVYFQVRGMSDAFYNSAYEPWSYYLTADTKRAAVPTYDPLEFWIEECHSRGMELFAWVNPYRIESSVTGSPWDTSASGIRADHPSWVMQNDAGSMSILNPGMTEVQDYIAAVVTDIVTNYDVDGVVFDDYFYLQSTSFDTDASLYSASGTSLSQANWRRENVNTMVRKVYNAIQSVKPYVKFGISPAGMAHKSASQYGVDASTVSSMSDWQYDGIYSDPLAWLAEGTVDFISPQIYWKVGASTNPYEVCSKYWSDACADVFKRHFYSSHSISFLTSSNTTSDWAEVADQIQYNRDYDRLDAPGCVMYASENFTGKKNSGLAPYLKSYSFTQLALQPAMTWKTKTEYGTVTNMALSGTTLSWTGESNVRYAVYAVPTGTSVDESDVSCVYLIGNPYSTSYDVSGYTSGYRLGVSIVDRMGNEFEVAWLGESEVTEELDKVTLYTPTSGTTVADSFDFTWSAIDGATYTVEISTSSSFTTTNFSKTATTTTLASSNFNLAANTTYYWRVKAAKTGYISSTSAISSFTTPEEEETPVDPTTLPKDPATYGAVGNYSIESVWHYTVNTDNFPSQLGGDQRAMTAYNGNIYIIERGGNILEFDGESGEYSQTIVLSGDHLTSSSGSSLGYNCNDIFVDGAGNLCISNMILSGTSYPFTVCTVNLSTGVATRVFEATLTSSAVSRIDYAAAYGDVTATGGQIWAVGSSTNYVFRWTRTSSGSWTAEYTTIGSYYTNTDNAATTNGTAPRIMPISTTQFILDGHNSAPTLYTFKASGTATLNDSFASKTAAAPTADNWNGLCTGTVSDQPIFAYVSAIAPNTFNIVTNPSNFTYSAMELLWTVPTAGFGSESNSYCSSQPAIISNSDGTATLYLYTPNNGLAAYKITYSGSSSETPTETLSAVTLSSPTNGATTTDGFSFAWSAIDGATYTLEVATNTTFTNIVASATTTANSYSSSNFSLSTGTTYYWRVTASKTGYNSSTSSTYSFTTSTPTLSAVTLTSPSAGATVSSGFNFTWSAITGATYTLELSTDSSFGTVAFSATTTSTSYSSSNFSLAANTTYYWRVKAAVSGYTSSTSASRSFTTPMESLAAVTLTSPTGGTTVSDGFDFSWSAIDGATYTLEVTSLSSFATVMYSASTTATIYSSENFDLAEGTTYYWRVTASKSGYSSSTSATASFVTPVTSTPDVPGATTDNPDGGTYDVVNGLKIENLWIYSINTNNFPSQLGADQRGMAAYNGNLYISERLDGAGYLHEFSGETGEYLRKIALSGDYLTLSSGSTLGYPCNDVFVDGGGHLCVSNLVTSFSTSGQLTICTVDISTGVTTRVFQSSITSSGPGSSSSSTISLRIDYCGVYGDITSAGAVVYAAAASGSSSTYQKRVYAWTLGTSGSWTSKTLSASSFYPSTASYFGIAPRVLPISSTSVIVDGTTTYPTLYSYSSSPSSRPGQTTSLTLADSFASNSAIKPNGMASAGMCSGEVDGKPLYIYAYDDSEIDFYDFAIVYNPNEYDYASMELMWIVPQNGLGNVGHGYATSIPATINNEDGSMTLFVYTPANGIAGYRISKDDATGIGDIDDKDAGCRITVKNRVAHVSQKARTIEVYTTSGALVASASDCKSINLSTLVNGIYVVNAVTDSETIAERIVLK